MKRRILAIFLAALTVIGLCSVGASAEGSVYAGAVSALAGSAFQANFSMELSYDGASESYENVFVRNSNGDLMLVYGSETENVYFTNTAANGLVAVTYVANDETCEDGWYSFDESSIVFFYIWTEDMACNFLDMDYADDMFDIATNGNVATLTAKEEYMQEIAFSFFGDYNNEAEGITDVYTSFVLTVTDGVLSGVSADNVYSNTEDSVEYKYTVTYTHCDSITVPAYNEYIYRTPLPAEPVGELPVGETFAVTVNPTVYSYTPAVDVAVNFSSSSDAEVDPCMDIYVADGDFYVVEDYTDDNGDSLMFSDSFILRQGVTYYFAFSSYTDMEGLSFNVSAVPMVFYGDDINGDGKVSNLDAATVLRYDAGLTTLDDAALAKADANGDGKVSSLDAAYYLMYDAGLIFEPAPAVVTLE